IPAAAPHEANVSTLPRRRSKACTRGKYITELSLRNGHVRSASRAVREDTQLIGGSTMSMACRSRQDLAATGEGLGATSCSRARGGMHRILESAGNANRPV